MIYYITVKKKEMQEKKVGKQWKWVHNDIFIIYYNIFEEFSSYIELKKSSHLLFDNLWHEEI